MKRFAVILFGCFCITSAFAATKMYVSGEKIYGFSVDNLKTTVPQFVENEDKQNAVADKYISLMDENGRVSVADLFEICRTAGFNTYRQAGFDKCSEFLSKLAENAEIELEHTTLSGYCPGLNADGTNPNALRSITEETRIGDMCGSTNINYGEVIFRKGYNCTCFAMGCNDGFVFEKDEQGNEKQGRCITPVVQPVVNAEVKKKCSSIEVPFEIGTSIKEITTALQRAKNTCRQELEKRGCGDIYKAFIPYLDKKAIICNPDEEEVAGFKQKALEQKQKKKQDAEKLTYYEVCGKDKGKTGKTEHCVTDYFNWTRTQLSVAIGFAQEYARNENHHDIYCSKKHRTEWNDDYVRCSTLDGKHLYEFKFDTIDEGIDRNRRESERRTLCKLAGGEMPVLNIGAWDSYVCKGLGDAACRNLSNMAKKYAHSTDFKDGLCYFNDETSSAISTNDFNEKLAKIEGIDNRAFYNTQLVRYRNKFDLEKEIEKYIKQHLSGVIYVNCDEGFDTVKVGDGLLSFITGEKDDVLHCFVDGKPIDFVFDDLSEWWNYQRDASEKGVMCVTFDRNGRPNATWDGRDCRGLNKTECDDFEKELVKQLNAKGWNNDGDLVDWDDDAKTCEINDAQFAQNLNKVVGYTAAVIGTALAVVTAPVTAVAAGVSQGVVLAGAVVEFIGIGVEITTDIKSRTLKADWANDILKYGNICNDNNCARKLIMEFLHKSEQINGQIDYTVVEQVDGVMTRLAGLLSDEELEYAIANAKEPGCWDTLECQKILGSVMQMGSLIVSGYAILRNLPNFAKIVSSRLARNAVKSNVSGASVPITNSMKVGDKVVNSAGKEVAKNLPAKQLNSNTVQEMENLAKKMENATSHAERTKASQELNQLQNQIIKSGATQDDIAKAVEKGSTAYKDLEKAQKEYDAALEALNKRQAWEKANPGAAKQGMNAKGEYVSGAGKTARDNLAKAEQKLRDLGQDVKHVQPAPKAESVSTASKTATNATSATKNTAAVDFEKDLDAIKDSGMKSYSDLSADDAKRLSDAARKRGLEVQYNGAFNEYTVRKSSSAAADAGRNVDKAADAGKVADNAADVVESSTADNILNNISDYNQALKNTPERNWVYNKDLMTDDQWKALNNSLIKDNIEVVSSGRVMILRKKFANMDRVSDIRNRAYSEFNIRTDNIKKGIEKELHIPKERLADDEWRLLREDLGKEGLEITETNDYYFTVRKSVGTTPVANNVADISMNILKSKASRNFETHLSKVKASELDNPYTAAFDAKNMTASEWEQLNKSLNKYDVELVDIIDGDGIARKRMQRIGAKTDNATPVVKNTTTGNDLFSRSYNDVSDEVLNTKLAYIYENSKDIRSAVNALKDSGIYDSARTSALAKDLAEETVKRIRNSNLDIINRMKRYKYMNNEERMHLAADLHEIITTERRNHIGNTLVGYDFTTEWSWKKGHGTLDNGFEFSYGLKGDSVNDLINVIFHENTHALQELGKSALPKAVAEWNIRNYADPKNYGALYYNNLVEIEAYQIGKEAAEHVVRVLGL